MLINLYAFIDDEDKRAKTFLKSLIELAIFFLNYSIKKPKYKNVCLNAFYICFNIIFDNIIVAWLTYAELCESIKNHKNAGQKIDIKISDELHNELNDIAQSEEMQENNYFRVCIELKTTVFKIKGHTLYIIEKVRTTNPEEL